MTQTTQETVFQSWGSISDTEGFCMVSLQDKETILIAVADSEPASGNYDGFVLSPGGLTSISFDSVEAGDSVFARTLGPNTVEVHVVKPGTSGGGR